MKKHAGSALAALVLLAPSVSAQTIVVTSPTGTERVGTGGDFATDILGNPWDFSDAADGSPYILGWQSYSIAGGFFSGLTTATSGAVSSIVMQYQGEMQTNHVRPEGVFYPIDATKYTRLSIRMYTDKPGYMRLLYYRQPGWIVDTAASNYVTLITGWNVYDIDLNALGGYCAGASCSIPGWGGTVLGFGIEPNTANSANVQIDWVRLRAGDTGATQFPIAWTANDPTGSAVVDLFADDDANASNGFIDTIASGVDASQGGYSWPVNRIASNPYYVYAVIGTSYAGNALQDEWDMSQPSDVTWVNWTSASVSGGVFTGVSQSGAAAIFPRLPVNHPVNTSAYHYLHVRMNVETATSARVVWRRVGASNFDASNYWTVNPGMQDYVIDLATYPGWNGEVEVVRLNPTFASSNTVTIDFVGLSSSPTFDASPPTGSDYSSGPVKVNEAPQIFVTDPDETGGDDFATTVLGNTWDMNDAADIPATANLTNIVFSGGEFSATSTNNDPGVYFYTSPTPGIDAAKYHLMTVRYKNDSPFQVPGGSVSRIFWRPDLASQVASVTQDILAYPGYTTITLDLSTVLLENNPPLNLPIPWQGTELEVRFDPMEFGGGSSFHVDYAKLAAEDASTGLFDITWQDSDSDSAATIDLFWDTDNSGFNGTPIVTGIAEDDPANTYAWNTGGAPAGPLWVYARITDGYDTVYRYATGVMINTVVDSVPPYLTLLSPGRGATGVSPNAPIKAHVRDAYSGVNIASVTMSVDGSPVTPVKTGGSSDVVLVYTPASGFTFGQTVTVQIDADDLNAAPNHLTDTYTFTTTPITDTDGDGMPDGFETASNLDPLDPTGVEGASGDADLDGQANLAEYQAGSDPTSPAELATGPGPSPTSPPSVKILYPEGTPEPSFAKTAYAVNKYGVNVAVGAIESPTARVVMTGPGPGDVFGPQIKAFRPDNTDVTKINFYAYGTLKFGAFPGSANTDTDPWDEIVTSPGRGPVFGPHIRGWNFDGGTLSAISRINFFAYSTLKYGAHVAGGNVDGDGFDELVTGPGPGVVFGPVVRGFNVDGGSATSIAKINFQGVPVNSYGAEVATGDVDGDGFAEMLVCPGPGPSYGSLIMGYDFDGSAVANIAGITTFGFSTSYGAVPAAGDLDGDRIDEIVEGVGPDPAGSSDVHGYDYSAGAMTSLPGNPFTAYSASTYGTRVASGELGFY
ncbi:MAG: Ig-like domain-containing protein [Acidobacteriota bacterium]